MRKHTKAAVAGVALALVAGACAGERTPDIQTREVTYQQGETALHGYVAWDGAREGRRPGVLLVHEWWGHNEHARAQARRLAEAGYVGFALDMYGEGRTAAHPADAEALMMGVVSDLDLLTARFNAGLEQLRQDAHVDPDRIAAIGYCFGGTVVLGMARAGADLDAVVSFHGGLAVPVPVDSGAVRARVLVLTGADDPMVPAAQVAAFTEEMRVAGARIEVVSYPGVRHSFTNPDAAATGMEALAYDAEADRESWAAMLRLLEEMWD